MSDEEKIAIEQAACESFRKPYSCAQAVFAAFKEDATQSELDFMKTQSAGRAEGGVCGALFAARQFVSEQNKAVCDAFFKECAGELECRKIKSLGATACIDCVRYAVQAVCKFK